MHTHTLIKKLLLLSMLAAYGKSSCTLATIGPLLSSFKSSCEKHPIIAASVSLAALYGFSYGLNQILSKNQSIHVDLITTRTCPTHSQENFLFVHGIAETHEQAYWYTKGTSELPYFIDGKLFTYDFPDATQHFWRVNITQSGIGQSIEMKALENAYEQAIAALNEEDAPNKDVILIGLSRGASTILNFVGLKHPQRIKAIIVESPFDSTRTLSTHSLEKLGLDHLSCLQTIAHCALSAIFWQHSIHGIQARDIITEIDSEIPILFICSRQDTMIPAQSTIALYQALQEAGHEKIHIFIADHGRHGKILHGEDGHTYQAIVHAFYKQYGITYDAELAEKGEPFMINQP